jgi:hypothetical protein
MRIDGIIREKCAAIVYAGVEDVGDDSGNASSFEQFERWANKRHGEAVVKMSQW